MHLTDEQLAVIEAEDDLMAVTAYAGTGKTSTLRAYARKRPNETMLYLAFNKTMAGDAEKAFAGTPNVYVKTLHALAYQAFGKHFVGKLGNYRVLDLERYFPYQENGRAIGAARILFELLNSWTISSERMIRDFYKKSVRLFHADMKDAKVSSETMEEALEKVWDDMLSRRFIMTHNGYFKLFQLSNPGLPHFNTILIDEAQDINDAMFHTVMGLEGKKILVGDPYQQIYGWNGAVNALGKAVKRGAASYFLTRSFRCPDRVAALANRYLELLGARKKFKGTSLSVESSEPHKCGKVVIARTNATIFDFAARNMFKMKIFYNGGFHGYQFEILKDINYLRIGARDLVRDPFIRKFSSYGALDSYAGEAQDIVMKARLEVERKYGREVHHVYNCMFRTSALDEKEADLVISTAHKAKGQEYGDVTLLSDFISLSDVFEQAEKEQEKPQSLTVSREEFHLIYVAVTRSFNKLSVPRAYIFGEDAVKHFRTLVKKREIIFV
ncbi:MAG: UvrD-helicase domain-containing protein [Deltaproteobacteria bacterium]|nr:UvrD-helicase domain-containing protein [Deltaproteobacteria bacterium]